MTCRRLWIGLAIGGACLGCDDAPTPSSSPDLGVDDLLCHPDETTVYRVTELRIPTAMEASSGAVVGMDVDGMGTVCGADDYPDGVDNAFIDLTAALSDVPTSGDPLDLQAEIDAGLACESFSSDCAPLVIGVRVAGNAARGCLSVEFLDADGESLSGPFFASLDASGRLRGAGATLPLRIPLRTEAGGTVDLELTVSNVIFEGVVGATELTDLVLGGYLARESLEETLMTVTPQLRDDISYDDVAEALGDLYDVSVDGECTGLSIGLTARGAPI